MKLANSNSGNTGKKYIKLTGNEIASDKDKERANKFAAWYALEIYNIQRDLIGKEIYNPDTMSDTFLSVYTNICYKNLEIDSYRSYFYRAYFTNMIGGKIKQQNEQKMVTNFDDPFLNSNMHLSNDDDEHETSTSTLDSFTCSSTIKMHEQIQSLESDILAFVAANYKPTTLTLYRTYINANFSCRETADKLGMPYKAVHNNIYNINRRIAQIFRHRRNELAYADN